MSEGTPVSRWVAIDFETASREKASACALGIAVVEDGRLVESHDWLIQPPGNIFEARNTWIHGIDEDLVAQEPEFDELWADIEQHLSGATLLAHNASFDIAVLRASLSRYELEPPEVQGYYCTVSMARKVWPQLPNHKLDSVCGYCGIDLAHHDAASDAAASARIALRCRRETDSDSLEALVERLGLSAGRL
ncbi:exonuclease [bacterium]|nr:exonuclease [bacterium]